MVHYHLKSTQVCIQLYVARTQFQFQVMIVDFQILPSKANKNIPVEFQLVPRFFFLWQPGISLQDLHCWDTCKRVTLQLSENLCCFGKSATAYMHSGPSFSSLLGAKVSSREQPPYSDAYFGIPNGKHIAQRTYSLSLSEKEKLAGI